MFTAYDEFAPRLPILEDSNNRGVFFRNAPFILSLYRALLGEFALSQDEALDMLSQITSYKVREDYGNDPIAIVINLLFLLVLSQEYVRAGAPDTPFYQTAGTLLLAVRNWAFFIGAGFAFTLSALILNYILFQSRLVPRWLSGWGFAGAALMFASYLAQFFGFDPVEFLFVPIAVQEMVFALWLIVKGFNPSAIASLSAQQNQIPEAT